MICHPVVSIIIPCYNAASFIADAINSVLGQTYNSFEIILINDGSTDNTMEVLNKFSHDNRLIYYCQTNEGLSAARNKGVELAKGEYIALLDADDIWLPQKLAQQMMLFSSDPAVDMVFTDFATFDSTGVVASSKLPDKGVELVTYSELFARNNFIYPSTVMIRKSIFSECGGFDTALRSIEDYDMWLRIARRHKIACIPAPLVSIRQHDSNMSTNVARMLEYELVVLEKNRSDFTLAKFRKRKARTYYLAADRLACQLQQRQSFVMLLRGIACWPLLVCIIVVLTKILLGGDRVIKLRRAISSDNSMFRTLYWMIYRRY